MAYSHSITHSFSGSGVTFQKQNAYSESGHHGVDESVADSATDYEIAFELDVSEIESIVILSDQDVTLETNSGTVPDDTIALKANKPFVWNNDGYYANPFSADITALFVTNASGSAARFQLEVVYDPTP